MGYRSHVTGEMDEVTLQVDANVNAPGLSRSRLEPMKSALGERYDDVVLVVSELVSNSVRHARSGKQSDGIDVKVSVLTGYIRVEVADAGPGFSIDAPRGNGMGLSIVEKLADRWGMSDGHRKFVVWAELSADQSP
jgi:anti-sigma regulatory factor (Ser/Thr protein kinase)